MKVSIITVSYNSKNTIERTILSVLNQTYNNIEYIVIDGNSIDGSIDIINRYKTNISKFISEQDNGIYDAMNKGIKLATGEIICFLNSDDIYMNHNTISEVVSEFMINNYDIIYGDVIFFKDNINKIVRHYSSKNFNFKMLKFGLMPAHQSIFIKNKIFLKFGNFTIKYKIAGDFDWVVRVFKDNKINYKYIPKVFVKMQLGGISTNGLKSKFLINYEILQSLKYHKIYSNYFMISLKYFYKIKGYLV